MKDRLRNEILIRMRNHLNPQQMSILETVLIAELQGVDVTMVQLPATIDTTNDYIIDTFSVRKAPKLAKETADHYVAAAKNLINLVNKPLTQITDMDIDYYLDIYESKSGVTPRTINNEKSYLSAFFSWMRKSHFILTNPCDGVDRRKEEDKPIIYIKDSEMEELREACRNTRDRAIIEVLRSTGARVGEIPQINISDINWYAGVVSIRSEKKGPIRKVIVDECCRYYIKEYMRERSQCGIESDALIATCRYPYNRLKKEGIRDVVKIVCNRTGNAEIIEKITPHKFRSTLITRMGMRGCDFSMIQAIAGHKSGSPVTIKHYMAIPEAQIQHAHEMYAS